MVAWVAGSVAEGALLANRGCGGGGGGRRGSARSIRVAAFGAAAWRVTMGWFGATVCEVPQLPWPPSQPTPPWACLTTHAPTPPGPHPPWPPAGFPPQGQLLPQPRAWGGTPLGQASTPWTPHSPGCTVSGLGAWGEPAVGWNDPSSGAVVLLPGPHPWWLDLRPSMQHPHVLGHTLVIFRPWNLPATTAGGGGLPAGVAHLGEQRGTVGMAE